MNSRRRIGGALLLAAAMAGSAFAQTTVYQTSFESASDPSGSNFTLGALSGKGGWTDDAGGTANVVNTPLTAPLGTNYVSLGTNTAISRSVSSASGRVLLRGYYYGGGSATLQVPDSGTPMAAVLGFRTLTASTFTVAAYNGQTGAYVEATGPPSFSSTQWHKIVVSLNYSAKTYDVSVNNQPLLQGIRFRDLSVAALTGFQSYSETNSNVDGIGFFASTGDFDNDGFSDDVEMATPGYDPLDSSVPGFMIGDVDNNQLVSPMDAQLAFQCFLTGTCTLQQTNAADVAPDDGDNCVDLADGDGLVTPADAQRIFNLFIGLETLCP